MSILLILFFMFDLVQKYKYGLKTDKVLEYKNEFFKFTCNRHGDDGQLTRDEVITFLKK